MLAEEVPGRKWWRLAALAGVLADLETTKIRQTGGLEAQPLVVCWPSTPPRPPLKRLAGLLLTLLAQQLRTDWMKRALSQTDWMLQLLRVHQMGLQPLLVRHWPGHQKGWPPVHPPATCKPLQSTPKAILGLDAS